MDRCRCPDYAEAVKKLKFFTVGTLRPDIIENHDRTGYAVSWFKMGISHTDRKFVRPKARMVLQWHELPQNRLTGEAKKIEQMWCPFMSPHMEPVAADEGQNLYIPKEESKETPE